MRGASGVGGLGQLDGPAERGGSCGEGRVLWRGAGPAEGVGSVGRGGSCRGH